MHGKDNIAIKRYVISFWNGIDLRYKLLKGPSVKISIAGIIISRVREPSFNTNLNAINLKIVFTCRVAMRHRIWRGTELVETPLTQHQL